MASTSHFQAFKASVALTALMLALAPSYTHAAAPAAADKIEKTAVKTAPSGYGKNYIGEMQSITASQDDTLVHIGRQYGLGYVEIKAANPELDPWIPGSGSRVVIPTMNLLPDQAPRSGLVINLAEMRMYYYKDKGKAPLTYAIGIGRDGLETPLGTTTVVRKKEGPTWIPTDRMRREDPTLPAQVGPGLDNPMGTHALYLGFPLVAIHGTDKPYGIGRRVSSGCIRMFPEDITEVFKIIPVGMKVTVVDQPIKAAWIDDKLFLEVHPTQAQATAMEKDGSVPEYQLTDRDLAYIVRVAGPQGANLDWAAVRRVVKERKGYPIEIARKGAASTQTASIAEIKAVVQPQPTAPKAALKPKPMQSAKVKPAAVPDMPKPAYDDKAMDAAPAREIFIRQ